MKHFFVFSIFYSLFSIFSIVPSLYAAWWGDMDYSFGPNGFQKKSFSVHHNVSTNIAVGMNVAVYQDDLIYKDASFSFRMPVAYSSGKFLVSVKPFYYPDFSGMRSKAYGGKLYYMTPLLDPEDTEKGFAHLIFSMAGAVQESRITSNSALKDKKWTEGSLEAQIERNFFNEFFFFASASLFKNFSDIKQSELRNPVLEHSEMAFLGTVNKITYIPESALNLQFARNMGPDFNSHLYVGFSKISFRELKDAHSAVFGMKIKITDNTSADAVYNWFKTGGHVNKNYYKFFLQMFF